MRHTGTRRRTVFFVFLLISAILLAGSSAPAAEKSFAYPKAKSKKGLYVCPGMEEDALELGVKHTTINLSVGDFMPSAAYRNSTHCISFSYGGKTYWFAKNTIARYDQELNRLSAGNVIVTAILLLPNRSDDLKSLIYPAARSKSANYYQWNMDDASAVQTLRAIVTFFQRRYSNPSGARIVGWIVGNEVNNSATWNWAGNIGVDKYVDLYAAQVAEVYKAARAVYANARIYMCLDHYWSVGNGSYWYAGKTILTKFASCMSARGFKKGSWNIAYHPYNISQYVTDIMSSSAAVTNKVSTRIITMKNLKVLTKFVKKHYTKKCRVILSEQGYSSLTSGRNTSVEQAQSIALAYYIAQQNAMVDSLILHRHVDHTGEGERYGLYTSWGGENASARKLSWLTYKYVDTTKKTKYTRYAAKQAKKLLGKKVKKIVRVRTGKLKASGEVKWKNYYTNNFRAYGALSGFSGAGGVYTMTHDASRNVNVPWGMIRSGMINCKTFRKFGFGIFVSGSTSSKAELTLRLWSGGNRYFEAQTTVACGGWRNYYANLKKWKYRGSITRVDILLNRNGSWSDGAYAAVRNVGIRK